MPPRKSLFDNVWVKILIIFIPFALTCIGLMIQTWADVRDIKEQRALITDGRLVRLEESQKAQNQQIDDIKKQLEKLWSRRRSSSPDER